VTTWHQYKKPPIGPVASRSPPLPRSPFLIAARALDFRALLGGSLIHAGINFLLKNTGKQLVYIPTRGVEICRIQLYFGRLCAFPSLFVACSSPGGEPNQSYVEPVYDKLRCRCDAASVVRRSATGWDC